MFEGGAAFADGRRTRGGDGDSGGRIGRDHRGQRELSPVLAPSHGNRSGDEGNEPRAPVTPDLGGESAADDHGPGDDHEGSAHRIIMPESLSPRSARAAFKMVLSRHSVHRSSHRSKGEVVDTA